MASWLLICYKYPYTCLYVSRHNTLTNCLILTCCIICLGICFCCKFEPWNGWFLSIWCLILQRMLRWTNSWDQCLPIWGFVGSAPTIKKNAEFCEESSPSKWLDNACIIAILPRIPVTFFHDSYILSRGIPTYTFNLPRSHPQKGAPPTHPSNTYPPFPSRRPLQVGCLHPLPVRVRQKN